MFWPESLEWDFLQPNLNGVGGYHDNDSHALGAVTLQGFMHVGTGTSVRN